MLIPSCCSVSADGLLFARASGSCIFRVVLSVNIMCRLEFEKYIDDYYIKSTNLVCKFAISLEGRGQCYTATGVVVLGIELGIGLGLALSATVRIPHHPLTALLRLWKRGPGSKNRPVKGNFAHYHHYGTRSTAYPVHVSGPLRGLEHNATPPLPAPCPYKYTLWYS